MGTLYRAIQLGLLQAAVLLCTAGPAGATATLSEENAPPAIERAVADDTAKPAISWLDQTTHPQLPGSVDTLASGLATPAPLVASHTSHIGRQREDMDLSANDSAIQRYNLKDDEPLLNEQWWQALPGIAFAVIVALVMYMRHPIQRKRKYRRSPHEPYGPYTRGHD